jgi:ankyrin repeat protein
LDIAAMPPLHIACARGEYAIVKRLLKAKADVNAGDPANGGMTTLLCACWYGHLDVVKLLFAHGADVNTASDSGSTALQIACGQGHVVVANMLLTERGADVDTANIGGGTALYQACGFGRVDTVKLLLEHGADSTKAAHNGTTPLEVARQRGHEDILKLLLNKPIAKRGKPEAPVMSSEALAEATSKADAVMAALLLEEEKEANGATKKAKKKPKKKKKKAQEKEKAEAPTVIDGESFADIWGQAEAEELPGLEPMPPPHHQRQRQVAAIPAAEKAANEESDAALKAVLEAEPHELDALVAAINARADHASPELLKEARTTRDTVRKDQKKALKQEKREAETQGEEMQALLWLLVKVEDISELQAAIIEAEGLAGVAPSLDAEVEMARERLVDLRAAAKTSAIEDQQDLMEEHAVASVLQGLSMTPEPEPDRKPSAEEEEVGWRAVFTGRIDEMERQKEAAVAEEDYLSAAEIKRSIAELVEQMEAVERAVNEEDTKRSSAAAGPDEPDECVICMDERKSHTMIPCGHRCVCEACADRITDEGETCPICRAAVSTTMAIYI